MIPRHPSIFFVRATIWVRCFATAKRLPHRPLPSTKSCSAHPRMACFCRGSMFQYFVYSLPSSLTQTQLCIYGMFPPLGGQRSQSCFGLAELPCSRDAWPRCIHATRGRPKVTARFTFFSTVPQLSVDLLTKSSGSLMRRGVAKGSSRMMKILSSALCARDSILPRADPLGRC